MAWPTASSAFLRDPDGIFKHDGFGHDRAQDAGLRTPCFRANPHSGVDMTGRGPIYSAAGGTVVVSENTKGAGHSLIEDVTVPGFGRVFPIYFHAAAPMTPVGATTRPGDHIGVIGDTGTGTAKGAFHLHFAVATSLKAAVALIRVGTRARYKNETVTQWAAAHGLIDPLPFLRAVRAAKAADTAAPTIQPEPEEAPDMQLIQHKDRGIAVVGPNYFHSLTPEELPHAVDLYGWPKVYASARDFDVTRALHTLDANDYVDDEETRARNADVQAKLDDILAAQSGVR